MRTVRRLPHVDRVAVEERVATLAKRSIKADAKQQGIRLAVSVLDLTTLEGADTPGKVRQLAAKAVCPAPAPPEIPAARRSASIPRSWAPRTRRWPAGACGSPRWRPGSRRARLARDAPEETREAVAAGADEIDMVISREA